MTDKLNRRDADRLELLDRIADRVPELDLDQHSVDWAELPEGAQALLVDGGGIDGGTASLKTQLRSATDTFSSQVSKAASLISTPPPTAGGPSFQTWAKQMTNATDQLVKSYNEAFASVSC